MPIDFKNISFVQARWYTPVNSPARNIQLIVLHSMEAPEMGNTAESVANYFHTSSTVASAHYCCDVNSIVQCVQCKDVAYGAPKANHNGVHIEMAGYAKQTREEWLNDYGKAMIANVAGLCAEVLMPKFDIPLTFVNAAMLREGGKKGFTTHAEVSRAFNPGGHWDPGPGFPVDYLFQQIKAHVSNLKG